MPLSDEEFSFNDTSSDQDSGYSETTSMVMSDADDFFADDDSETSAQRYERGEEYYDDQESLLEAFKEAIEHEALAIIKRLMPGAKFSETGLSDGGANFWDDCFLQEHVDALQQLMLETANPEIFEIFQNDGMLCFTRKELMSLFYTALEDDVYEAIFPALVTHLDFSPEKLLECFFNVAAEGSHVEFILSYCLSEHAHTAQLKKELPLLAELMDAESEERSILQLITSLLYERKRHAWNDSPCLLRRELIQQIDSSYKDWTEDDFKEFLEAEETEQQDFFGVNLSSDSDSDDETTFNLKTAAVQRSELGVASAVAARAQVKKLATFYNQPRATLIDISPPSYNLQQRAMLRQDESKAITDDLAYLNAHFAQAEATNSVQALLDSLPTKFLIMQIRGVTYSTSHWNKDQRRLHRQQNEVGMHLYSAAAYREANLGMDANGDAPLLLEKAEKIRDFLLLLRTRRQVAHAGKTYATAADLLQDIYTNEYANYLTLLKSLGYEGNANPFVSTSDRPYHALRYAFGIKFYEGKNAEGRENKSFRLRPRWQKSGQAERSKSGKYYLLLMDLNEYILANPSSPTALVWAGRIHVTTEIIRERETTFPGYAPRVHAQAVAKYPSFKGNYKKVFQIKYGLDQALYELFREAILETAPHSAEHKAAKMLLGDWLCAYHEVRLIRAAEQYAASQPHKTVLVYRQYDGTFDFQLGPDTPFQKPKEAEKEQSKAVREQVINARQRQHSSPAFFNSPQEVAASCAEEQKTQAEFFALADLFAAIDLNATPKQLDPLFAEVASETTTLAPTPGRR